MQQRSKSTTPAPARGHSVVKVVEERGALEVFIPSADVTIIAVSGHLSTSMVEAWIEHFEPLFARGDAFQTFLDWETLASYDMAARQRLTRWVVGNVRNVKSADFLVSSRLVAMGVSAANLATTLVGLTMRSHTWRVDFEKVLAAALREAPRST